MKRGFSFSTVILVGVLLGVLVWIGHIVNPPSASTGHDHDHGDEHAPAQQAQKPTPMDAKTSKAREAQMMAQMQKQKTEQMAAMKAQMAKPGGGKMSPAPKDEMNASYFYEHDMGTPAAKPDAKTP